jgi:carboxylesterase type B
MVNWLQTPLILFSFFFCCCQTEHDDDHPTSHVRVSLEHLGKVQGIRSQGMDFFGGIPYASPPVGNLRWAPPEEPPSWKPHALDASQFGPDCYQIPDELANPFASYDSMSEDCLYLNIYTPAGASSLTRRTQLPVMVWFHGGAFQQGAAKRPEYDARRLAQQEMVIVVTVNYRLGALGFLVASELGLLGNFGLMDQRAALYFVNRHIAKFGGNPNSITLFGESAGAVMIGLHLQMHNPGLFHKAILQSNPMGYQFRSVVVADFLGDAVRRAVDCRDLQCLRGEPVEEIMRAQSSLMGIPRSVGDFFAWGPTLTHHRTLYSSSSSSSNPTAKTSSTAAAGTSIIRLDRHPRYFSVDAYGAKQREATKFAVNVSQPMLNLHLIPDHIPIIIGTNKHEGEMFVHSAFPISMNKAVYWMFAGALFKDSAAKVLRHYRPYVTQLEMEAQKVAQDQLLEEESKQYYTEHEELFEKEYQRMLNKTSNEGDAFVVTPETVEQLVKTFNAGGAQGRATEGSSDDLEQNPQNASAWWRNPFRLDPERQEARQRLKEERTKQRALKEAAKVVLDYRPVMSRIINDYLFRCPSWHYAHLISNKRKTNNVYVYRFSQPTHVPGYKECWGKSCHTSELPYVFQTMDVIRANYSTLSQYAQDEAPVPPEYPYTQILKAHRGELEEDIDTTANSASHNGTSSEFSSHPKSFQKILKHFFDDYFMEDADEEIASDMAQRWVAFARTGDPNYEEAKIQWVPWRYIPKGDDQPPSSEDYLPWEDDFDVWSDEDSDEDISQKHSWSDNRPGRAFRRRALEALNMEVVDEDELRTELKRTNPSHKDSGTSFSARHFLAHLGLTEGDGTDEDIPTKSFIRQVRRIAQDMGVLGTGLKGTEDSRGPSRTYNDWDDDFFPQLLELKWPPEDRLVERDCTCDFWERIRCKTPVYYTVTPYPVPHTDIFICTHRSLLAGDFHDLTSLVITEGTLLLRYASYAEKKKLGAA